MHKQTLSVEYSIRRGAARTVTTEPLHYFETAEIPAKIHNRCVALAGDDDRIIVRKITDGSDVNFVCGGSHFARRRWPMRCLSRPRLLARLALCENHHRLHARTVQHGAELGHGPTGVS